MLKATKLKQETNLKEMKTSLSYSFTLSSCTQLTTIKMVVSQLCNNQIMIKHSVSECCTMPYKTIYVPNLFFVDLFQATSDFHFFEILAIIPRWKLLSFHYCILRLGNLHMRNNTTLLSRICYTEFSDHKMQ